MDQEPLVFEPKSLTTKLHTVFFKVRVTVSVKKHEITFWFYDFCLSSFHIQFAKWIEPIFGQCSHFISLKTPKKLTFSGVFRGFKMGTLARNELMHCFNRKKQNLKCYIRLGRLPAQTLMNTWQAFTPNLVTKLQETVTIQWWITFEWNCPLFSVLDLALGQPKEILGVVSSTSLYYLHVIRRFTIP